MPNYCLADKGGYGQCILIKGHEGSKHKDAFGYTFILEPAKPKYWAKYWAPDNINFIGSVVKCRFFYKRSNAISFCDEIASGRLIQYNIPGY
jgi:hypothetical protein